MTLMEESEDDYFGSFQQKTEAPEVEELILPTPYEKEIELLRKLLTEVETDKHSDFDNEVCGPHDVLEKNFSDHESFSEHDTESEEDGDSGEEVNNSEWFAQTMAYSGGKEI
ncbi:hypothetical protein AVEN_238927-1 [Araneus ventricosus]|uniref:Uncharacterized protein n=1 Tax=Araneus ventricosus TaxID=182803 RepID=A0A4Y2LVX3_ARAVE|nr:hypothetical protein AVEN_238927-1 [Araneus ventricosus]